MRTLEAAVIVAGALPMLGTVLAPTGADGAPVAAHTARSVCARHPLPVPTRPRCDRPSCHEGTPREDVREGARSPREGDEGVAVAAVETNMTETRRRPASTGIVAIDLTENST